LSDKKVRDTEYQKYLITLPKNIVEDSILLGKDLVGQVRLQLSIEEQKTY